MTGANKSQDNSSSSSNTPCSTPLSACANASNTSITINNTEEKDKKNCVLNIMPNHDFSEYSFFLLI